VLISKGNSPFCKHLELIPCEYRRYIHKGLISSSNFLGIHRFRAYGDQLAMRSAEDIAYAVLRFFAKGGSMVNYYMVWIYFMFLK
jgi:hypothetical protein